MQIAATAHEGQSDKTGAPYFSHCQRVADGVESDGEKIVAYLHDIVEKGKGWTLERIRAEGFTSEIIDAVNALTRRPEETDEEFVTRAAGNALARPVKLADLKDNLAQAKKTGADTAKYIAGLRTLEILRADPNVDEI
ncbi:MULTISPECIES: HD domain-containing protein [unclassified Rhizobium]|uniref:HD domain-containing protein n=1 Tax=unclassified Rhizobium TaxID=2613769 RepID=UPI00104AC0E6|nr:MULTISPECIES: HD domain-containing protein [unclassified Rhizobium]